VALLRHVVAIVTGLSLMPAMAVAQPALPDPIASRKVDPDSILIEFPGKDHGKPIRAGGFLLLPAGSGKVPVMVIEHGSGGVTREHEYWYAHVLNDMGVAAFIIDNFSPRGIDTTYDHQEAVSMYGPTNDALSALKALQKVKRIDVDRAGIVGFSKGALAAYFSALRRYPPLMVAPPKSAPRYRLHVLIYPACSIQPYDLRTTGAPIYMMLGAEDRYTGVESCKLLEKKFQAAGADIHSIIYPGAGHAWDKDGVWKHPHAEVFSKCLFEQQADDTWSEKTSGVKSIVSLQGNAHHQALSKCLRYGAVTAGNAQVKARAMEDFKRYVRQYLLAPAVR
jgi:dienelactone hydrolase